MLAPSSSSESLAKKAKREEKPSMKMKLTKGAVLALRQGASTQSDLGFKPVLRLVSIAPLPETILQVPRYKATFSDGVATCSAVVRSHLAGLVENRSLIPGAAVRLNSFSVNSRSDTSVLLMLEDVVVLAPP